MKRPYLQLLVAVSMTASLVVLTSCKSEPKAPATAAPPRSEHRVTTQPGVAGGVTEDVLIVEAIVTAVDVPSRRVTLTGPEGRQFTFTAGPEIRNLPQMHVGDKVTATFARRMVVTVRSDDASPSITREVAEGRARLGEKPGMLVAEETEKVARVTAIDTVNRTATLEFADTVRTIPVRSDVDLSRYKVGDNVVVRVTTALTVLVRAP